MKKEEYCFDGTANIICRKCRTIHEVAFDGTDLDSSVEDAIERGMNEAGWDANNHFCPNCYEEFEEVEGCEEDFDEERYEEELNNDYDDDFDDEEE